MIKTQINIIKNQNKKIQRDKVKVTHFELEKERDGGEVWGF